MRGEDCARSRPAGAGLRRWMAAALAGAGLALAAGAAPAGEPAEEAAALEGEGAECRYIAQLCSALQLRDRELASARSDVSADATVENVDRYRDAFLAAETAAMHLAEAAKAIRGKHRREPACFCDCAELARMRMSETCRSQ